MKSGIDTALHVIGGARNFRVPHEGKEMWYAPLDERPHAPEFPVRIPPPFWVMRMSCAGIKKLSPPSSPIPKTMQPLSFLSPRSHVRQVAREREQFLPRLCLRMLRNPCDGLTDDVDEATLDDCRWPVRLNGLKQAFLAVADDKSRRWNTRKDCRPGRGGFVRCECP